MLGRFVVTHLVNQLEAQPSKLDNIRINVAYCFMNNLSKGFHLIEQTLNFILISRFQLIEHLISVGLCFNVLFKPE